MKDRITAHYTHGQLLDRILSGVEAIGKTPDTVTVDELAPADEFHIGGRQASEEFIGQTRCAQHRYGPRGIVPGTALPQQDFLR